jgi:hypothetical protein
MKTLEEKKLLVKMAKMFGQEVDQALIESIEREEKLNAAFFKKSKAEEPAIPILKEDLLVEADPPPPAPAFTPPIVSNTATQTMNLLNTAAPNLMSTLERAEIEGVKKTLADLMKKIGTLSWGGGGTGAVRINDQDDFDRTSYGEGRYLRWKNGMFRLDTLTAGDVVNNTTLVNDDEYYVLDEDWYIGVNYPGTVTIHLPTTAANGRNLVIKDESGNCANNPIIATGTVDNDAGGFNLQINNGAIHMVYRSGWRII